VVTVAGGTDTPGVVTEGVVTGGVFTGGVFTGGVFTGGVLSGGVFPDEVVLAGGVFPGGVFPDEVVLAGRVLPGGVLAEFGAGGFGAPFDRAGAGRAGWVPDEADAGSWDAPVDAGLVVDGRAAVDGAAVDPGERTVAPLDVEAAAGLEADVEAVEGVTAAGALAETRAAGGAAVSGRTPGGRGDFLVDAARAASARACGGRVPRRPGEDPARCGVAALGGRDTANAAAGLGRAADAVCEPFSPIRLAVALVAGAAVASGCGVGMRFATTSPPAPTTTRLAVPTARRAARYRRSHGQTSLDEGVSPRSDRAFRAARRPRKTSTRAAVADTPSSAASSG
jgi:hypothetical protein